MSIMVMYFGAILLGVMDFLQPDEHRKPKANQNLSVAGGFLWLAGVVWSFFTTPFFIVLLFTIGTFVLVNTLKSLRRSE